MRIRSLLSLCTFVLLTGSVGAQTFPNRPRFPGGTEPGIPFQLPLERAPVTNWQNVVTQRRVPHGTANAFTVSWDGRLVMYRSGDWSIPIPNGANAEGYAFNTFDKELVDLSSGIPDFTNCFGQNELQRFATLKKESAAVPNPVLPPDTSGNNDYPHIQDNDGDGVDDYTGPYPYVAGTMGELGLLTPDSLSNNMYPMPADEMSPYTGGVNPYPSTDTGEVAAEGSDYLTYQVCVTLQDQTKFWDGSKWKAPLGWPASSESATRYQAGLYPNGQVIDPGKTAALTKRNGRAKLKIIVDWEHREVIKVIVMDKWKPFIVTPPNPIPNGTATAPLGLSIPDINHMYADTFEPTLTLDGYLMVGKGQRRQVQSKGDSSRVLFFYNPTTPFGETGWFGPWELHELYGLRNTDIDGKTLAERYPIARRPLKDYDGSPLTTFTEGGYTWLSHDGRFVIYSCRSGGTNNAHPNVSINDGGGTSNRAQVSIVGSVTGWQLWRIDHAAVNPSRHLYTAWDEDSRTIFQRTGSFGFGPGFWELLRGAPGLPLRDDDSMKLQLVNSLRLLYYELDLSPYQERDYGFYLPMTLMLALGQPGTGDEDERTIDLDWTPDLSGNAHPAEVDGAQLPCEYFELPSAINLGNKPGLYEAATSPTDIHPLWTTNDVITVQVPGGPDEYWAPLADWKDGVDEDRDGQIDTQPYAGEGTARDMDSDTCWGRVGQAMFFKESTLVRVYNTGTPPELNPGTAIQDATRQLTASLWVNPNQPRTGWARLMKHNFLIKLSDDGEAYVSVDGDNGTTESLTSNPGGPPIGQTLPRIPDGEWAHIALTWKDTGTETDNTSVMRLFVNGEEMPGSPKTLAFDKLATHTGNIRIGCLNSCATDADKAVVLLDEVALKNSAMTDEEVARAALLPVVEPSWVTGNASLPNDPVVPFVNADDGRVPANNLFTEDKAELGADLFHDVQLSTSLSVSCATCHDPANGFQDNLASSIGVSGPTPRSTPPLYNLRYHTKQFWDARSDSLEDQAILPILGSEMNQSLNETQATDRLVDYVQGDLDYSTRFISEFTDVSVAADIDEGHVSKALATYMRALTSTDANADGALTGDALDGKNLFFGKARCSGCHNGPDFTDGLLHRTGTLRKTNPDLGAGSDTASPDTAGRAKFAGAFKTPGLRNVADTEPYFHDGSAIDLPAVIDFYNEGGVRTDGYDLLEVEHDLVDEEINRPLGLTTGEKADLVAYLNALSGNVIDNGPAGLNQAPVVSVAINIGPQNKVRVHFDDPNGIDDVDTSLNWAFELKTTVTGGSEISYTFDDGFSMPSPNGGITYFLIPNIGPVTGASARVTDMHGRSSGWVSN